ncbi:hypothetical protein [Geobacter sp. AOG1]|uniref:hypothetical protein n=1 Tax=Geobacter sp. AOG1 TaxID=1566346 RepID=UPI001CC4FB9B|nr:hypothetical protein [Geobacter sp. AOG1]GFE56730.1 hypothetical protein AOG1_06090 [Geobacter sp. AOG1]
MAWRIPTAKHDALRARFHTCTCAPDADVTYDWRDMRVIDIDFEQPGTATSDRCIWYAIGCYDCGNYVLDNMPFGIQETGYELFSAAKAEATEYIIDLNGVPLAPDDELAIRVTTAEAVRDIWSRYCEDGITGTPNLLMHDGELKLLYDSIKLVIADSAKLPHAGISRDSDLSGAINSTGIAYLQKLADEMIFRFHTATPRIFYGKNYHYLKLHQHMAQPITSCIAYAAGHPTQMAQYLFATYGDAIARGLCESDYIRSFEASRKSITPYYRLLMADLAHYYHHA